MDTSRLYEEIMLEDYFAKVKYLRNQMEYKPENQLSNVAFLIDAGGEQYDQYKFVMDSCKETVFEMHSRVIMELLKYYEIPVNYYDVKTREANLYYFNKTEHPVGYTEKYSEKEVLAFSRKDKGTGVLYIFKQFGLGNQMPNNALNDLMKANNLVNYCYISDADSNAYSEIIGHNEDENDLTRGTNIISIRQFFELFFGQDEYDRFNHYASQFTEKVKDYYGFAIVRTLTPHTINNFRSALRENFRKMDVLGIVAANGIDESDITLIDKYFFEEKRYNILLGSSEFAQSYMTSEWLYSSLNGAGNIDLTAIFMGYLKSVEQFLFTFIKNHTYERDRKERELWVNNTYKNQPLTDELMNDPEKTKHMSLGSYAGFFGHYSKNKNKYDLRNKDLLVQGIKEATHKLIVDALEKAVKSRNGYFHRDNITNWDTVNELQMAYRGNPMTTSNGG